MSESQDKPAVARVYQPDDALSTGDLYTKWSGCRQCKLGDNLALRATDTPEGDEPPQQPRRTGSSHGLLVVGLAPSRNDERDGAHFGRGPWNRDKRTYDPSGGDLLKALFRKLQMGQVFYTSLVACRSCELQLNEDGTPRTFERKGAQMPYYKDRPPLYPEISACQPRLWEEIYCVDPLLILSTQPEVTQYLLGKRCLADGEVGQMGIPGVTKIPRQDARGQYTRMMRGVRVPYLTPTLLKYPVMQIPNPDLALQRHANKRQDGELNQLKQCVQLAVQVYQRYREESGLTTEETHGADPGS